MAEPTRVLLRGGSVYSPADPFATAMLVSGGSVAWVGGDGASLAMADGVDEVVELEGALVTPAFVDAYCPRPVPPRPGVGLLLADAERVLRELPATTVGALRGAGPVVLVPDQDGSLAGFAMAGLAASGVPFAFGSGGAQMDPWQVVAAAVNHPDPMQRISARAAFAAHTRGGWRAAGRPEGGVLVPGAPADYAIWEVTDLVVQAPDDRIAAWSTDPRSGTPGLPDLSPGSPLPRCLRTVVGGATR